MWEDILINMGVSALLVAVKNEHRRQMMKAVFLKIFRATWSAFSSDPEFQSVVSSSTNS